MSLNFNKIVPSRYVTFTIDNPFPHPYPNAFRSANLHVSVIDSPSAASINPITVAAILVPPNRESDWIFSTEAGLLQLILASQDISRLIVISSDPQDPSSYKPPLNSSSINPSEIEEKLEPLMLELAPNSLFAGLPDGVVPEIPFVSYEDKVIRSLVLEICVGSRVGEMLIENVELGSSENDNGREFRRRLRFKRMPNYIQSQVRILAENGLDLGDELENMKFKLDNDGLLIQPYLSPMVAGLSVISSYLGGRIRNGIMPRALCLGIGGGALVTFLNTQLGFEVVGVDEDEVVLNIGKKYFGLSDCDSVHLCVFDGIELMKDLGSGGQDQDVAAYCRKAEKGFRLVKLGDKFDVIMVDLDSSDAKMGSSAPPVEFVERTVLLGTRKILCESGVLILNLMAPNKSFYEMVVSEVLGVFEELYEIDSGNEENLVLIASISEVQTASADQDNWFLQKLRSIIQESYISSMRRIPRAPAC